jgi:uncharacterized protein YggU (UPF0235/DUF167 family)
VIGSPRSVLLAPLSFGSGSGSDAVAHPASTPNQLTNLPHSPPFTRHKMPPPGATSAVRWLKTTGAKQSAMCQVFCHVKPGVAPKREGISAVSSECVHINVSNPPLDHGANIGVEKVLAKALSLPRSDVQIIKGLTSPFKTVKISIWSKALPEEKVNFVRTQLENSVMPRDPNEGGEEASTGG